MTGYLPFAVAAWIFAAGVYGLATSRHAVHLCLCLGVLQTSTYVLLAAIGYRVGGTAPVLDHPLSRPVVDPVVQALMLTDVVVEATVVALLLTIAIQLREKRGTIDPEKVDEVSG